MAVVRLRTLTEKSKIGWGQYAEQTVGEMINAGQQGKLVWLYYNVQWINFAEDVLDKLPIFPEQRIEKPGIDAEMFTKRLNAIKFSHHGEKAKYIIAHNRKKNAKRNLKHTEQNTDFTKAELQAINHGHAKRRVFR